MGKKRHRIDFARQLIVGALLRSSEEKKQLAYLTKDKESNKLVQLLDPSLPWWTKHDRWARWTTIIPTGTAVDDSIPSLSENSEITVLNPDPLSAAHNTMSFADFVCDFAGTDTDTTSLERQISISALCFLY